MTTSRKLAFLVVTCLTFALGSPARSHAQDATATSGDAAPAEQTSEEATSEVVAQTPEAPAAYQEASPEVRVAQALGVDSAQLRLDDIHRRSRSATALYISSFVLLGTGLGGMVFGTVLLVGGSFGGSTGGAGAALFVGGGVVVLGHVITLALAIAYDVGSGSRRDSLYRDHPELRARLTGGPGDVGLGLALDF